MVWHTTLRKRENGDYRSGWTAGNVSTRDEVFAASKAYYCPTSYAPNVPAVAFLLSDPTRWAMLAVLLDGRALPAGELAFAAGVSAQTASSHLSKLHDGGLVTMEKQGRHHYYRLADARVAQAIEQLAT